MQLIKIFIPCLAFFFISCNVPEDERRKKTAGKTLKKYQVGLLNKIPDGPLTDEHLQKAYIDDWERRNGLVKNNTDIGIVYIAPNLRNKRLGKFRIQAQGIHMLFPTDTNTVKYQDLRDNENFQHFMENNRVEYEKNKISESETKFKLNPFKEIIDQESPMIKSDLIKVNRNHEKNLWQLAIDKEEDIYKNMVKNELQEFQVKHYNKGVINPILNYNTLLEKEEPQGLAKDSQGNAKFLYAE